MPVAFEIYKLYTWMQNKRQVLDLMSLINKLLNVKTSNEKIIQLFSQL